MVISKGAARRLAYRKFTLNHSDFEAGRDDDTSLDAGTVGEIGMAEIGEDGQLANYLAVQIGQPPENRMGDNRGNEVYVDLQTSAPAQVDDTIDWAFAVRDKGEVGGGRSGNITGYISGNQDADDPRQRRNLGPKVPIARSGKILQLLCRDDTQSFEVSLNDSEFRIPALGGQD